MMRETVQHSSLLCRKGLTARERRAIEHARALAECKQGRHNTTPTFRPGETVCLVCALVVYCPVCLQKNNLPPPQAHRAFPLVCGLHQQQEVQA
jgi:hypothetical protein